MNFLHSLGLLHAYLNKSIMIVSKRVQLGPAQVEQSVPVSVNNVVALASFEVDEVEDLSR